MINYTITNQLQESNTNNEEDQLEPISDLNEKFSFENPKKNDEDNTEEPIPDFPPHRRSN